MQMFNFCIMIKVLRLSAFWLLFLTLFDRCSYNDITELEANVDCSKSSLAISLSSKQDASTCRSIDGKIGVSASGGFPPYDFSINGGTYQTGGEFNNLAPGDYILEVKDIRNCPQTIDVVLDAANSTLTASYQTTADTQCLSDNGSITVTGSGGQSPYLYQIDAGGFANANTFSGLKSGRHSVVVKDATDCQKVLSIQVAHSTGTSYSGVINTILQNNCTSSGCHGTNSSNGDWTNYAKVKDKASLIKIRTSDKTMPIGGNSLTDTEIQLIACWVDDGALNN
jgi:hypothetical protein